MDSFFKISERKSTIGNEIIGGLTTFLAMAYIIAVNPNMLVVAGVPFDAALTATCFGAAIMTIAMGLIANRPIALASGMGINAIVAYTLCLGGAAVDWRVAMAIVFLEGIVILILVACGLRKAVMDAIPVSLRHAIGIGIGLFIAFIGLKGGGIIVANESTILGLGDLSAPVAIVSLIAIAVAVVLQVLNVKGGLLISIIVATIAGIPLGVTPLPSSWSFGLDFSAFAAPFQTIPGTDTMAIAQVFLQPALLLFVFSLLMSDFFDTMGTVVAVGEQADFVDENGDVKDIQPILMVDSAAAAVGGFVGASSVTSFVESTSGAAAGAHGPLEPGGRHPVRDLRVRIAHHRHGVELRDLRRARRRWLSHAFRRHQHRLDAHRVRIPGVRDHHGHPDDLLDHQRYRLRLHFLLRDHAGHRQGARGQAPHVGGCHRVFGHVHLKLAVSFAALEGPRLSNRLLSRRLFDGEALRFLAPDRDDVISKVT